MKYILASILIVGSVCGIIACVFAFAQTQSAWILPLLIIFALVLGVVLDET